MRYHYQCKVRAKDCFVLYMQRILHSMVGISSLVLIGALVAVTVRFWGETSTGGRVILVIACLAIPVIQPLGTYLRSVKQVSMIPKDLELSFGDNGIYVTTGGKAETIPWKKVGYVVKERNMVIIITKAGGGYMLTDEVLGEQKEALYQYASSKIS